MIRYLHITIFLLISSRIGAQNPFIDSLWKAVDQAPTLTEKVEEFNYLAQEYNEIDLQESIDISRRALRIAKKISYTEGIFYAYNNLGTAYDDLGVGDSAFYYFDSAHALAVEMEDKYAMSVVKHNFGLYYLIRGNFDLALKYFQEALEGIDDMGPYVDPVVTYNNIGVIHEEQGNLEKAITYYQKCGEVAMKTGDVPFAYLSFGYIEQLRKRYDQAIGFYQDALKIYREDHDELHIGETLYYLGECELGRGAYERARQLLQESLATYEKLEMVPDVVEIFRTMAEAYEQEGNNEAALALYHQAAEKAEASELPTALVPVFKALARQYALKNDYAKAYQYQLRYQELNDTIFDNETKERIAQLETSYELAVSKAEKERLQAEQSEREIAVKQRTNLAVASTLVAVLFAFLVGVYDRANRREKLLNKNLELKVKERTAELEHVNNRLLESNDELERFTYIASHDLKEPLRNITSFINLIERKIDQRSDPELEEYMNYVTRNARQLYNLIEDVLNFSHIATLDVRDVEWLDLNTVLFDVEATLSNMIKEKNACVKVSPLPLVKAHQSHVFMLFKNLIENGLKYNESERPLVEVDFREEQACWRFVVRDNGIGISGPYHEQIFEMFKRITTRDKYEGTGIGLATCKKIVSKYGGSIWVESREGQGSTFYFTWPKVYS